jgi:aminoglycoside phosphotransferase (APT) family kinase protein
MTAETLVPLIAEVLAAERPDWRKLEVHQVAGGLEFKAFRARTQAGEELFLRAADERFSSNDNDAQVDARRLLVQEAKLARILDGSGVPVPRVHQLVLGDRIDVLVTECVADDGSSIADADVLAVLAKLHNVAVPALDLVAQEHPSTARTLAERLTRRLAVVAQLDDLHKTPIPSMALLREAADVPGASLLHLDVRRANGLARGGKLMGLVDWTNALVGPPALEYARLAEYGEVRVPAACFEGVPEQAELVFRLDAAVMLAVVFLSEAPSPVDAERQVTRVRDLLHRLVH